MTTSHIVIDLETLSTAPNAAVASAGITLIKRNSSGVFEVIDTLSCTIDIDGYGETLGTVFNVSGSTISWWMKQEKKAQDSAFSGGTQPWKIADDIYNFIARIRDDSENIRIYGLGANFDPMVTEHFLITYGLAAPWGFRDVRCLRTLFDVFEIDWKANLPDGEAHNAMSDSLAEAKGLLEILNRNVSAPSTSDSSDGEGKK